MGFLDKLKVQASGLKEKAVDTATKNSDKIATGLDKAGDFVDKKTQGKYADKIATGKAKAKEGLDKLETTQSGTAAPPPPPPVVDNPIVPAPPAPPTPEPVVEGLTVPEPPPVSEAQPADEPDQSPPISERGL
jgi:hypothetical protein